jgi:hypothetical protein
MKRVLLIVVASLAIFAGVASADTGVTVGDGWHAFITPAGTGVGGVAIESPYTFTASAPVLVTVTDIFCIGDRFTISDGASTLGTTSVPGPPNCSVPDTGLPDVALADPDYSHGRFALGPGAHAVTITLTTAPFGNASGYIRFDLMTTQDCQNAGWETITATPSFTNESDCIAFVTPPAVIPRISRGDAEAVFNANPGRESIVLHSPTLQGAPDNQFVRIGPFGAANGRHFCALDWHVLGANISELGSYQVASAVLAGLRVQVTLDGAPFTLRKAPVKRADPGFALAMFGSADAWGEMFGGLLAPNALPVGVHTTSISLTDPSTGEIDTGSATFFVDAPGTGTCA